MPSRKSTRRWATDPANKAQKQKHREDYIERKSKQFGLVYPSGIYVIKMQDIYKIGSSKNVAGRLVSLSTLLPYPIELFHLIPAIGRTRGEIKVAELFIHDMFRHCRLNGEWFNLSEDDIWLLLRMDVFSGEERQETLWEP